MEGMESREARRRKPGYQRQRTREVLGVKLVQVGEAGGWWRTEDGRFEVEVYEGAYGGWTLKDRQGEPSCHSSLKSACREIQRRKVQEAIQ